MTDWSVFARCKAVGCRAYEGEPCVDTRHWPGLISRKPIKKTPHKGRPKKGEQT